MTLKEMLEKRNALMASLRAANESGREDEFTKLENEIRELDAKISETEKRQERMASLTTQGEEIDARANQPERKPVRDEKPTVFAGEDRAKFSTLGHQMQEVRYREQRGVYKADGVYEARAASGLNIKVDEEGGMLVDPEFTTNMMPTIMSDAGLLGRVASRPMSGNLMVLRQIKSYNKSSSRTGICVVYWPDEAVAITKSQPVFERITLQLRKCAALVYATDEMMEDALFMASEVNEAVGLEIRKSIENEIFDGNGTSRPQGILKSAALLSVDIEDGQALADAPVLAQNLVTMYSRIPASFRADMIMLYNQEHDANFPMMSFVGGTAAYPVFMPPGGVSEAPHGRFYGRPMIPFEGCKKPGTVGDIAMFSPSQYLLGYKGNAGSPEIKAAMSIHVKFVEGDVAFRFTTRVDGRTRQSSMFTPENASEGVKYSPFVTLAARV